MDRCVYGREAVDRADDNSDAVAACDAETDAAGQTDGYDSIVSTSGCRPAVSHPTGRPVIYQCNVNEVSNSVHNIKKVKCAV